MGVGADATQKAFYSQDIMNFLARTPMAVPRHFYENNLAENTRHVCVAVDPAGGGASAFAVASLVQIPNGGIVVRRFQPPPPPQPPPQPPIIYHCCAPHDVIWYGMVWYDTVWYGIV